jgi:hypothetical protein
MPSLWITEHHIRRRIRKDILRGLPPELEELNYSEKNPYFNAGEEKILKKIHTSMLSE